MPLLSEAVFVECLVTAMRRTTMTGCPGKPFPLLQAQFPSPCLTSDSQQMSPAEWGLSWEPGKRPQLSYRHRALAVHVGVTVTLSCRDMPTLTIPTQVSWPWLGLEVIWRVVVPGRRCQLSWSGKRVLEEGPNNSSEGSGGKRDCT